MQPEQALNMPIEEFFNWMEYNFSYETSPRMESDDDVHRGLDMLSVYAETVNYLKTLSSLAKIKTRMLKRMGKEYRTEYEDMVDRGNIIENKIDSIKLSYQTVNKCINVYMDERRQPDSFTRRAGNGR